MANSGIVELHKISFIVSSLGVKVRELGKFVSDTKNKTSNPTNNSDEAKNQSGARD